MNMSDSSQHPNFSRTVLIVLAHYKHNASIHAFLRHVSNLELPINWALEVVVCDNSDDFQMIQDVDVQLSVYNPGENKFYFGGCWFALQKWQQENGSLPEWVIVANHDLVLEDRFFVKMLSAHVDQDVGVVAPDVKLPNGIDQNPQILNRPSLFSMYLRTIAFKHPFIYSMMNLRYTLKMKLKLLRITKQACSPCEPNPPHSDQIEIYCPNGSIFLFRKTFFDRGGSLASKALMYHEEFLVAERCRRMGLRILMDQNLHVVHNESTVIQLISSRIQYQWMKCLSRVLIDIYRTGEKQSWI